MAAHGVPHVAKYLWTDDDFEAMGWHDVIVHGFRSEPSDHGVTRASDRLLFDLDYIVKRVVEQPLNAINCWMSPATLVFEDVRGIIGDALFHERVCLDGVARSEPDESGARKWTLHAGELGADYPFDLTFWSQGFRQYLRQPPMLTTGECLSLKQRGGISFAEEAAG